MSVVNEVLRDLSQRQPEAYAHLRAETPTTIAPNRHGLLWLLMALILSSLLALYWWQSREHAPTTKPAAPASNPSLVAANTTAATDVQPVIELPAAGAQQYHVEPLAAAQPAADDIELAEIKLVTTTASERNKEDISTTTPLVAKVQQTKKNVSADSSAANSNTPPIDIKPAVLSVAEQQQTLSQSAQLALSRGDVVAAEKWLREAHELAPDETSVRNSWLKTLIAVDSARAETQLQLLLQRHPEDWLLRELLASLWIRQQRFDAALSTLHAASPPMTSAADYYALKALALQQTEQHPEALSLYRALMQLQPQHGAHYAGAAISAERIGDIQFANLAYGQALADPQLPAPLRAYAEQRRRQLLQATP